MIKKPPVRALRLATLGLALSLTAGPVFANDTVSSKDAPDLTGVRAKIAAKDWGGAITDLKKLADTNQHADVYNLLGFSLRKSGDTKTAYTFYMKALDFDPAHKGAHEYLGELYVETGDLPKAKAMLAKLETLCPQGCEERDDLAKTIASAAIGGKSATQ
jgi:Flp pilus assembly protein TadD